MPFPVLLAIALAPAAAANPAAEALKAKDYPRAERLCRERLVQQPGDGKALVNLGLSLEGQGRTRDAIEHWQSLRGRGLQGVPSDAQLDTRIAGLRAPAAVPAPSLDGIHGAVLNPRSGEATLVFTGQPASDKLSEGRLYDLAPIKDGSHHYTAKLRLRNLADGRMEAALLVTTAKPGEYSIQDLAAGMLGPDGVLRASGGQYRFLVATGVARTWSPTRTRRFSWQIGGLHLGQKIYTVGGSDTHRVPPYGFGAALALEDDLIGLLALTTPAPDGTLLAQYAQDAGRTALDTQATQAGSFFYPLRDGRVWPGSLEPQSWEASYQYRLSPGSTPGTLDGLQVWYRQGKTNAFALSSGFTLGFQEEPLSPGETEQLHRILERRAGTGLAELLSGHELRPLAMAPYQGRFQCAAPFLTSDKGLGFSSEEDRHQWQNRSLALSEAGQALGLGSRPPVPSKVFPLGWLVPVSGSAPAAAAAAPSPAPASPLAGHWRGSLSQPGWPDFQLQVELRESAGQITGTSAITSSVGLKAVMELNGSPQPGGITLTELRIRPGQDSSMPWCLKRMKLRLGPGGTSLVGTWDSTGSGCPGGGVILER